MLTLLARWLLGTALVSWRYLWMTTPLHRLEAPGSREEDLPPAVPTDLRYGPLQLPGSGVGPMFHRRFRVDIAESRMAPAELMATVASRFDRLVPREVVAIRGQKDRRLRVGEEFLVEMPGPWNGPVRVVRLDEQCLRLATLQGHLEAGQIQFRAYERSGLLAFEVEAWARCASRAVQLLYVRLRLAKEVQFNMWVRFCLAAAATTGGRPVNGVHICTRIVHEPQAEVDPDPATWEDASDEH